MPQDRGVRDQVRAADHQRPLRRRGQFRQLREVGDDADLRGAGLAPLPGDALRRQPVVPGIAGDHDGKGHRGTAW